MFSFSSNSRVLDNIRAKRSRMVKKKTTTNKWNRNEIEIKLRSYTQRNAGVREGKRDVAMDKKKSPPTSLE